MSDDMDMGTLPAAEFPREGTSAEKFRYLIRHAIMAPSSHNSQPWLFRIHDDQCELYADRTRGCRVTDPNDRELTISCGAALQNLEVAARNFEHATDIQTFPEAGDFDLLARIRLLGGCEAALEDNLLFSAIARRRTVRRPFEPDPVPPALLNALEVEAHEAGAWLHVVHSEDERFDLADLIAAADRDQWADKSYRLELAAWMHPNKTDSRDGLPGYAGGVGDILSHVGPLAVRTFDLGKGRAAKDRDLTLHSPTLAVLGADGDSPRDWLAAGRALQRVWLRATVEDLRVSFLNQPLQVAALRPEVSRIIRRDGHPQLILRLGFGPEAKATPRRSVQETLL